jgi:excisionase family DNA binding protein
MEPMLTVPEAARYLRIPRAQLYALIQQRKMPHIHLSEKRVVIRAADMAGSPLAGRAGLIRRPAALVSSGSRPPAVWSNGVANLSNELEEEGITT